MAGRSDVFIGVTRTRFVSNLDVTTERESDPPIDLNPRDPSVNVGGGVTDLPGTIEIRNTSGSETVGELTASEAGGRLELRDSSGTTTITVNGDPNAAAVSVGDLNATSTEMDPGQFDIYSATTAEEPVLAAGADGELALRDDRSLRTVRLRGPGSSLRLRGGPERDTATDSTSPEAAFGGGELVLASQQSPKDNLHVHARGEADSDYGVDNDNRPHIFLDGVTGTLELGRQKIDDDRLFSSGTIQLRSQREGNVVLEVDSQFLFTSDFTIRQFGEIRFSEYEDPKVRHRGTVRAHQDGLMIYDAGYYPALLLTPSGDMIVRNQPTTDSNL